MSKRLFLFAIQILLKMLLIEHTKGLPPIIFDKAKSLNVSHVSCGSIELEDSWLVELRVKKVTSYCKGVLISNTKILTTRDCKWLTKPALGGIYVTFPSIKGQLEIKTKTDVISEIVVLPQSSNADSATLTSKQIEDLYGMMVFELEAAPDSNFTPLCLPTTSTTTQKEEATCQNQEEETTIEAILCPREACDNDGDNSEDSRISGEAMVKKIDGQIVLKGLGVNTCPVNNKYSYINVTRFQQWLAVIASSTTIQIMEGVVKDICPQVEDGDNNYFCSQKNSLPGHFESTSKAPCKLWKALSRKEDDEVVLICNDHDVGEILRLPSKSFITCGTEDKIPLQDLENCNEGPLDSEIDITTMQTVEVTERFFFPPNELGNDSEIIFPHNDDVVDLGINGCPSEGDLQFRFCQFPFYYDGRYRFECVNRSEDRGPECLFNDEEGNKIWLKCSQSCPLMKYHTTNEELKKDLFKIETRVPNYAKVSSLGNSVNGEELWSLRLADRNSTDDLTPMVKLVANMHGNEPTGRELLVHLVKYIVLAKEYLAKEEGPTTQDTLLHRAANILDTTDLWIVPSMNPDGFARGTEGVCFGGNYKAGRTNEGGKDLNRDFPSHKQKGQSIDELKLGRQTETQILIDFILKHPFVLSANFHDGAVLANYPYDDYRKRDRTGISRTPDHDVFYHLATTYSFNHAFMNDTSKECPYWGYFRDGVTNGAEWYEVLGGMQDFNYDFSNAMELTLELSCCKYTPREKLLVEWENNLKSLISFIEQAQNGLRGYVTDSNGEPIANAKIQVADQADNQKKFRAKDVITDKYGRYWRILLPGEYTIQAKSEDGNAVSDKHDVDVPSSGYTVFNITIPLTERLLTLS